MVRSYSDSSYVPFVVYVYGHLTIVKRQILDPLKLKDFEVSNSICGETGEILSTRDSSREKGPYGNCEKYQLWSACAVRAG